MPVVCSLFERLSLVGFLLDKQTSHLSTREGAGHPPHTVACSSLQLLVSLYSWLDLTKERVGDLCPAGPQTSAHIAAVDFMQHSDYSKGSLLAAFHAA